MIDDTENIYDAILMTDLRCIKLQLCQWKYNPLVNKNKMALGKIMSVTPMFVLKHHECFW